MWRREDEAECDIEIACVFFFFLFLGKPAMWLDIPEVFESHQGHQDHEKCQEASRLDTGGGGAVG